MKISHIGDIGRFSNLVGHVLEVSVLSAPFPSPGDNNMSQIWPDNLMGKQTIRSRTGAVGLMQMGAVACKDGLKGGVMNSAHPLHGESIQQYVSFRQTSLGMISTIGKRLKQYSAICPWYEHLTSAIIPYRQTRWGFTTRRKFEGESEIVHLLWALFHLFQCFTSNRFVLRECAEKQPGTCSKQKYFLIKKEEVDRTFSGKSRVARDATPADACPQRDSSLLPSSS